MDKAGAVGLWRMPEAQDEPCSQVSGKGERCTVEWAHCGEAGRMFCRADFVDRGRVDGARAVFPFFKVSALKWSRHHQRKDDEVANLLLSLPAAKSISVSNGILCCPHHASS